MPTLHLILGYQTFRFYPISRSPKFDRTTGSQIQMNLFHSINLKMQTAPVPQHLQEACMCKGFRACLEGVAIQWFMHLPIDSISSFAHLHQLFVQNFSSRKTTKRSDDLYAVMLRPGESLQNCVRRFNELKIAIPNGLEETAVTTFRKGLRRSTTLYWKLTKYPCTSMTEDLAKAAVEVRLDVEDENSGQNDKVRAPLARRTAP